MFTAPPVSGEADLRALSVFGDGSIDRSPNGAGTCAVMAVLDAMGSFAPGQTFRQEGPTGAIFTGTTTGRTRVGERDAILPVIEGSSWITGEHTFEVDDDDPLKRGFRL
jgi:proline racemase